MVETADNCPACGLMPLDDEGPLPVFPPDSFGGTAVKLGMASGHLFCCQNCDLRFRNPCLSDQELTRLYEALPDSAWEGHGEPVYWPLALRLLEAHAVTRKVMDVGCFGGGLLNWLPAEWVKFGVEPGNAARSLAESRGVKIVGCTAADLVGCGEKFGAVVTFDVIEHINRPMPFLEQLRDSLAPGGSIIVFTGATDSWPYRLLGRHYWYSSLPEHVSFYSESWFRWASAELGMRVTEVHRLSSEPRMWKLWFMQGVMICLRAVFTVLKERGIATEALQRLPVIGRVATWKVVPWWKQAKDHMMVVLTRDTQV
jgi:SAM-dependent methyltransferase